MKLNKIITVAIIAMLPLGAMANGHTGQTGTLPGLQQPTTNATPAQAGNGTLAPGTIAAIAAATAVTVNDEAEARAERAAAPRYKVFVDNFSPALEMTIAEIVATVNPAATSVQVTPNGIVLPSVILVSPAANGAALNTCAGFRAAAKLVVWNTGGSTAGICPGDNWSLVSAPIPVRAGGKLTGVSYNDGTGPQVISVPVVALSAPNGYVSLFVKTN